jgi:hypothetical protein
VSSTGRPVPPPPGRCSTLPAGCPRSRPSPS